MPDVPGRGVLGAGGPHRLRRNTGGRRRRGFDDEALYRELALAPASRRLPMQQILRDKAVAIFEEWRRMPGKVMY